MHRDEASRGTFSRQLLQILPLAARQWPELTGPKPVQRESSHPHARQIAHLVADLGEHSSNLPIANLTNGDLQNGLIARSLDDVDLGAAGLESALVRVGQPDAALKLLKRVAA